MDPMQSWNKTMFVGASLDTKRERINDLIQYLWSETTPQNLIDNPDQLLDVLGYLASAVKDIYAQMAADQVQPVKAR